MLQNNSTISVVLCAYNGEKFIGAQLDSILLQTYADLEIIISDDASTDDTFTLLQTYAANDKRIQLYRNKTTIGYNKNFEKVLQLATAKWIAIADQDDIWLPHKIEVLYKNVDAESLLIHSYNTEFTNNPSTTISNPSRVRFKGNKTRELLFYNTITGHTMLLHQSLLAIALPVPEGVYYDWWLGLVASIHGNVHLYDEALVLHRQHSENASHLKGDKKMVKEQFFTNRICVLQQFLRVPGLLAADIELVNRFINLLQSEWTKDFSWPVFLFFLKHARSAFYYRKKTPMLFYYVKYSFKKAGLKVKNWT